MIEFLEALARFWAMVRPRLVISAVRRSSCCRIRNALTATTVTTRSVVIRRVSFSLRESRTPGFAALPPVVASAILDVLSALSTQTSRVRPSILLEPGGRRQDVCHRLRDPRPGAHIRDGPADAEAPQAREGRRPTVEFEYSKRTREHLDQLTDFMQRHVYPAEPVFLAQLDLGPTRWQVP